MNVFPIPAAGVGEVEAPRGGEAFSPIPAPEELHVGVRPGAELDVEVGDLVRIDTRGRDNRTPLNLSPDHGMDATTKTLAIMDDNRFQVKTNKRELELGVYTHPKIFYLYDIIYVAVTDIQSQQVYLFRSTGASVPGFPLEGGGQADMADMDNDRHPELVVPYRENSIRVYRVNR